MLPLPEFDLLRPTTVADAIEALRDGAMPLGGGTDLMPNMKRGLATPQRLVSLNRIAKLKEISETSQGGLRIGAGVTLQQLTADPRITKSYAALAYAAAQVASPQIRARATLGGNLCLDTRCVYYNQTEFWREALGGCLKKIGDVCYVIPQGTRCVAAMSADTPGPLICYDATVTLASARGERTIPVAELFRGDGINYTVKEADELITHVDLPAPAAGQVCGYQKLRAREAIDFPILSVAVSAVRDGTGVSGVRIVVGALQAKPRLIKRLDTLCQNRAFDDALIDELAAAAEKQCKPVTNIAGCANWRQAMVPVLVRRALKQLPSS